MGKERGTLSENKGAKSKCKIQHKGCLFQRFVTMTVTAKKNVKKGNGFTRQNNNFAWASRFLLHFFAVTVHTTRTSNFLFLRFTMDVNTRRRFSFFFLNFLSFDTALMNSTLGQLANI